MFPVIDLDIGRHGRREVGQLRFLLGIWTERMTGARHARRG